MVKTHINNWEQILLKMNTVPSELDHRGTIGTVREKFLKEFLQNHIPETLAIGTGELINKDSKPDEHKKNNKRRQQDIVIYKKNFPKLHFSDDINAFFIQSVAATVEVKSSLTSVELEKAFISAGKTKEMYHPELCPNISTGTQSFSSEIIDNSNMIKCFVLAYDTTTSIDKLKETIEKQKCLVRTEYNFNFENLKQISLMTSNSLDGIYILGKGYWEYSNSGVWNYTECPTGSLYAFFKKLMTRCINIKNTYFDLKEYK